MIQLSEADKAQDILTRAKAGEDFDALLASEDNESKDAKALAAGKGMPIGENDSVFDSAVYTLAKDMNVGDVDMTQVEGKDADGNDTTAYYIVKRVEGTTGVVPYEEVKSVIDSSLKSYAESNYYNEKIDAWREKADITVDDDAVNAFDPAA